MNAQEESDNIWYLDSGCSNHMTGDRKKFVQLDDNVFSQVKLGDGKLQNIEGKGVIVVYIKRDNKRLISDVLYVPELTQNLLSVNMSIIYYDNMSAIAMSKNPVLHGRTKHIELRHYFIRDLVQNGEIQFEFVKTKEQLPDIMTKVVTTNKFSQFHEVMKITN